MYYNKKYVNDSRPAIIQLHNNRSAREAAHMRNGDHNDQN